MMKKILLLAALFAAFNAQSQQKIELHPDQSGLFIGGKDSIREAPYLLYFRAAGTAQRPAILICPGGAYTMLASKHEGRDVAEFFNANGYDAFVLMYRLNDHQQLGNRFPAQLQDVRRAMQFIRSSAIQFNLNSKKIGVLGFSAGGHLASMASTLYVNGTPNAPDPVEQFSSRPDFSVLVYPVISLVDSFAHAYSAEMLLGKNASTRLKDSLTTYKLVNAKTPPAIIIFSTDDGAVPPENGIRYYQQLKMHGVSASLHIFDHGGHGYGMAPKDPVLGKWPGLVIDFLK